MRSCDADCFTVTMAVLLSLWPEAGGYLVVISPTSKKINWLLQGMGGARDAHWNLMRCWNRTYLMGGARGCHRSELTSSSS